MLFVTAMYFFTAFFWIAFRLLNWPDYVTQPLWGAATYLATGFTVLLSANVAARLIYKPGDDENGRENFRLIVRGMGVILVLVALPFSVGTLLRAPLRQSMPGFTPLQILAWMTTYLISGLIVLLSANLLTRLVYGRAESIKDEN